MFALLFVRGMNEDRIRRYCNRVVRCWLLGGNGCDGNCKPHGGPVLGNASHILITCRIVVVDDQWCFSLCSRSLDKRRSSPHLSHPWATLLENQGPRSSPPEACCASLSYEFFSGRTTGAVGGRAGLARHLRYPERLQGGGGASNGAGSRGQ